MSFHTIHDLFDIILDKSKLTLFINGYGPGQYGSNGHGKKDGMGESHSTDLQNAEYVLTYEDKDGDWMLVGDVPWR